MAGGGSICEAKLPTKRELSIRMHYGRSREPPHLRYLSMKISKCGWREERGLCLQHCQSQKLSTKRELSIRMHYDRSREPAALTIESDDMRVSADGGSRTREARLEISSVTTTPHPQGVVSRRDGWGF